MPKKKVGDFTYDKENVLGAGQYGKVHLAEEIATKKKVAVKVIDKDKINQDPYTKDALLRQIQIMKSLKSPNIINFIEVHQTKNNIYIFQELAADGSLGDLLKKQVSLGQEQTVNFSAQMVRGFSQLAKHGIIHRDIKPANILLQGDILKLADFGFARYSENMSFMNSIVGTPAYMAPQVLNRQIHEHYSYKCDIWSFGIICYQMAYGTLPWLIKSQTLKQLYFEIEKQAKTGIKFPQNPEISPNLKDLINGCLKFDQKDRYDWIKIFEHPVFKNKLIQGPGIEKEGDIQQAFALTKLRMSIHAKNINLSKVFDNLPQQINQEEFDLVLQALDAYLTSRQISSIFKAVSKSSKTINQKDLLEHFKKNGFNLDGTKFSKLIKSKSTAYNQIDQKIEQIILNIDEKKIDIQKLFDKYSPGSLKELDQSAFSKMLLQINHNLSQGQLKEIFDIFADKTKAVPIEVCRQKFCKLAMVPNIKNQNIKNSLKKISKKSL